jgi:hypothetical protein
MQNFATNPGEDIPTLRTVTSGRYFGEINCQNFSSALNLHRCCPTEWDAATAMLA